MFGQDSYPYNVDLESSGFLLTSENVTFDQIKDSVFRTYQSYPELHQRKLDKAIWIKSTITSKYTSELILDFLRIDYVDLYLFDGDRLLYESKTGFLRPSSEKKMQRWNAIDIILLADKEYTAYYRVLYEVNDLNLNIKVHQRGEWRHQLLYGIMKDIAFLSVMLIISVYMLLTYFQNKSRTYLNLALYLLVVCLFYSYILDIMRDFFITEHPHITLYTVSLALLGPCFYFSFAREYLNIKELFPACDKILIIVVRLNLLVFILSLIIYSINNNYYVLVDIVRFSLAANVLTGIVLGILLTNKRNPLLYYYIVGSSFMLISTAVDLVLWTEAEQLGNIAQLGYIGEIIVFSMGLAKKNQLAEKERKIAQDSYINQLKINEMLIKNQKDRLEQKVKERTKELEHSKELAEKNARIKEEFLSVMSHEIRTPMNAIVGLTHMLNSKDQQDSFDENLTTLRYSVDNLMSLINNVLDYNKISAGKIELEQVDFDLQKIVLSVCHLFKSKADSKGLEFRIQIADDLPESVNGDPFRLTQILNNFLSNAIKFTNSGYISISVKLLESLGDKAKIQFKVADSGVGIEQNKQDAIFDSFTQASDDTSRKYGGTGLGLTISKDLIKLMGGDVEVNSKVGKGSEFTFNADFEITNRIADEFLHTKNYSRHKFRNLEDLSVLIVDDNQLNRMVLKKFMDRWNVASDSAENGKIALDKLRKESFDIVLLDLQMPEMDGYEMAKVMSGDQKLKSVPIIAISADTISNVYEKVIASGMDDFITKPFNPDELKSKIYTHTSKIK